MANREIQFAESRPGVVGTLLLTTVALVSFAANSLLCRLALGSAAIDPASFTMVRFGAGALVLLLVRSLRRAHAKGDRPGRSGIQLGGSWGGATALFVYAVCFSFAYLSLETGTGALILFAAVQITMLASALWAGERPGATEWLGLALALSGLVYLVIPGLQAPSPVGASLMALAGIGWGAYSLAGRRLGDPIDATGGNFLRVLAPLGLVSLLALEGAHANPEGLLWAVLSGALASGLGYVIWYAALRGLTATRAAIVQLIVPVLAAAGGVLALNERVTPRLLVAGALILGGVALAISTKSRRG